MASWMDTPPTAEELKSIKTSWMDSPPTEAELASIRQGNGINKEAALQGFGSAGTFGYLSELQAAAEPLSQKVYETVTGNKLDQPEPFKERLKGYRGRDVKLQEENPSSYMAGEIGGALALPIPGSTAAKGAGLASRLGRAAATGIAGGALYNPNARDMSGETGLNPEARLESAKMGGLLGLGGTAGAELVGAGGRAIADVPRRMMNAADTIAVASAGAKTGEMRKVLEKGKLGKLGEFLRNEGLVGGGQTVSDTMDKVGVIRQETGKQIGDTYKAVQSKLEEPGFLQSLGQAEKSALDKTALGTKDVISSIKDEVEKEFRGKAKGNQAVAAVNREIGNLKDLVTQRDEAGNVFKLKEIPMDGLLDFRKSLDKTINFDKSVRDMPATQSALKKMRDVIKDKVDSRIEALDKAVGGDSLKTLKALNQKYNLASEADDIASRAFARTESNNWLGLPDMIAGGLAGTASSIQHPENTPENMAKGLLTAAAYKQLRTRGPGIASQALAKTAGGLEKIGVPVVGEGVDSLTKKLTQKPGLLSSILTRVK